MRRAIEIEGIIGADKEMNLATEVGLRCPPN